MKTSHEYKGLIFWKSQITGTIGHGTEVLPFYDAKKHMDSNDKDFPELKHWFILI